MRIIESIWILIKSPIWTIKVVIFSFKKTWKEMYGKKKT